MPLFTAEALILRTYKLGEADRIVVFLTRDRGKKRAVASNARKSRKRIGAAHEPLTEVRVSYTAGSGRSKSTQVLIETADDTQERRVNQQQPPAIDGMWTSLGTFRFSADKPARVIIATGDSDGQVCADAVQFIRK